MAKNCKKCCCTKVKKDCFSRGKQRYKCNNCNYVFQNKSRNRKDELKFINTLWEEFAIHKQNYSELSLKYKRSIVWIQQQLDKFLVKKKI